MRQKNIKTAIVLLAVLLALSLAALVGILISRVTASAEPTTVIVPDNIVTPDTEVPSATETSPSTAETDSQTEPTSTPETNDSTHTETTETAAVLSLHNRNADDNTPFQVLNMFPGDRETKYYCVRVSYKDDVTLRFHADIRPGYEKLAEVLRCRIALPENGKVLYDGLMRDMPESLDHALKTDKSTTSEVYYEITVYLDTSVGNEYMNKDLIADFRWWVEDTGNLDSPQTGDSFTPYFWLCTASVSLFLLILLWKKRKKEGAANG